MPISHVIDRSAQRVTFDVSGSLSAEEMCDAIQRVAAEMAGEPVREILSDHRKLSSPATPQQLHALVACLGRYRETFGGASCAMVTSTPASYGMMRMLGVLVESIPIRVDVFTDSEKALEWLAERR